MVEKPGAKAGSVQGRDLWPEHQQCGAAGRGRPGNVNGYINNQCGGEPLRGLQKEGSTGVRNSGEPTRWSTKWISLGPRWSEEGPQGHGRWDGRLQHLCIPNFKEAVVQERKVGWKAWWRCERPIKSLPLSGMGGSRKLGWEGEDGGLRRIPGSPLQWDSNKGYQGMEAHFESGVVEKPSEDQRRGGLRTSEEVAGKRRKENG